MHIKLILTFRKDIEHVGSLILQTTQPKAKERPLKEMFPWLLLWRGDVRRPFQFYNRKQMIDGVRRKTVYYPCKNCILSQQMTTVSPSKYPWNKPIHARISALSNQPRYHAICISHASNTWKLIIIKKVFTLLFIHRNKFNGRLPLGHIAS